MKFIIATLVVMCVLSVADSKSIALPAKKARSRPVKSAGSDVQLVKQAGPDSQLVKQAGSDAQPVQQAGSDAAGPDAQPVQQAGSDAAGPDAQPAKPVAVAQKDLFKGPAVTLTCESSEADFELETRRRLAVYTSRREFCQQQKASVAIIDRCMKAAFAEWRRLEKQVEDLMVECSARAPDAPAPCSTQVAEYDEKLQSWRDQRTVSLTQCDALEGKEARRQCVDECQERFDLLRPRQPVCASKDAKQCAEATASYKKDLEAWETASQKELDSCESSKDKKECIDRAVVRWRPTKPLAPECSKEAVCDRDVREYRRQVRSLRAQRVASVRACNQAGKGQKNACLRGVRKHFRNRMALLKKPVCANADAPAVSVRSPCPKKASTWECKTQRCRGPEGKFVSSRCCSHEVRVKCARDLLVEGTKRCDTLKTRAARARCRGEIRQEADEITSKRKCPTITSFELRLKSLRKQHERDAAKCSTKDEKCRKTASDLFRELQLLVTQDPCFRKKSRCDADLREYRRAVRAINLERKQALQLCKTDKDCREDNRAIYELKRRQLERPVCKENEIHLPKSCTRLNRRYNRMHAEVARQREAGLAECRKLPNFEERRTCEHTLVTQMEKRRALIHKPLCKENERSYVCRARIAEYVRKLGRFRDSRRAAVKACDGDDKCESNVLTEYATKRVTLRRPACARRPMRNDACQESKAAYRKRLRQHNKKRTSARKACKKDAKCEAGVVSRFKKSRARIPLPACAIQVHTEIKKLRKCGSLKTRKLRQLCRQDILGRKVATPSKAGRRVRALTKCHRFSNRERRSACEKAARARFPHSRSDTLRQELKKCRKASDFHKCRTSVVAEGLTACRDSACRKRVRREARRFIISQFRKRAAACKTDECRRTSDSAFFRQLYQEERDERALRCKALPEGDRRDECLEGVAHRHRVVLGVRLCREAHKRGAERTKCIQKTRLAACEEFEDQDTKQRCIDRRTADERLRAARKLCRVHSRKSPERRKCLVEARRSLPDVNRRCEGRFGQGLLRCRRRNAREANAAATRRARRALRRCGADAACRALKQTDLLETRAMYRRYQRALFHCAKPTALRGEGTVTKCASDVHSDFKKRRAVTRLVRRCDRIDVSAGRKLCRSAGAKTMVKRHCRENDKACSERLLAFLTDEEEQRKTRINNHKRRAKCRRLGSKSAAKICLDAARKESRSLNRVERAKRACLALKDPKAQRECVRRGAGGSDDTPIRVVTAAKRSSPGIVSAIKFPLWAIAPITGGVLLLAALLIIAIAYRRVKARRSAQTISLASSVDGV